MMELNVNLDFECGCCNYPVGVTLKCEGQGLAAGLRTVAAVNVRCPTCATVNQLYFEPSGRVRSVAPLRNPLEIPQFSLN